MTRRHGPLGGEVPVGRRPRRSAGGDARAGVHVARRGQEHLRHRQLHAAEHRHADRAVEGGAADDRRATSSARRDAIYALEGSIAVTGSAVQWLRDQLGIIKYGVGDRGAGEHRRRTPAAPTSCRRSRGCSRRTGAPTRAARSSACRASTRGRTSRARRSKRSASRPAPCSTRWSTIRASRLELLKVDGGATVNDTLMQLQADILGVAGRAAGRRRDDGARRRLRGRPGDRLLERTSTSCAQNWRADRQLGADAGAPTSASRPTADGRRRWSGR